MSIGACLLSEGSPDANLINDSNVSKTVPGNTLNEFKASAAISLRQDIDALHC